MHTAGSLVCHVLVSFYQLLLMCFAVASWSGHNAIASGTGWLAFFIVAYILNLIETTVVAVQHHPLSSKSNKGGYKSVVLALWHWIYDILIGLLVLIFFASHPGAHVGGDLLLLELIARIQWGVVLAVMIAGWFVDVGLLLVLFFGSLSDL